MLDMNCIAKHLSNKWALKWTRTPTAFRPVSISVLIFFFESTLSPAILQLHKGRGTDRQTDTTRFKMIPRWRRKVSVPDRRKEDSTCSSFRILLDCVYRNSFRNFFCPLSWRRHCPPRALSSLTVNRSKQQLTGLQLILNMAPERYQDDTGPPGAEAEHENTIPIGLNSSRSSRGRRTCSSRRRSWCWLAATTFLMVFGVFPKGEHFNWKISYACFHVCWEGIIRRWRWRSWGRLSIIINSWRARTILYDLVAAADADSSDVCSIPLFYY